MWRFNEKTIALGITGSIAAYRSLDLIRELYRQGACAVHALLTPGAAQFITPLSLQMISHHPVWADELALDVHQNPVHIAMAQQADVLLLHPVTANTLGKLAHGLADNLVTTTAMTFTDKPVVIIPAMNTRMWEHPLTQQHLNTLKNVPNYHVVSPAEGLLACGERGMGHLPSQSLILDALYGALHPDHGRLTGLKAIVTAGGTVTEIDPVRQITNHSTGKMGIALADELHAMGASVLLISTRPLDAKPYPIEIAPTVNAMAACLERLVPQADWLWMAAALSDFKVETVSPTKLKRQPGGLSLQLAAEQDVLATLAAGKQAHQRFIGFAAESGANRQEALDKLKRKGLDAIALNDISRSDIGFAAEDNEVHWLRADGRTEFISRRPKALVARAMILALLAETDVVSSPCLSMVER